MTAAGAAPRRSSIVWACYLLLLGTTLIVGPNPLLGLFGIAPATEVWVRVVGMFVLFMSYLNFHAWRTGSVEVMRLGVQLRLTVPLFFGTFVALGWMQPVLLLFAAVDVASALWTHATLRAEGLA